MQVLFQLMWYNPPYPNEQLISLHLSHPMYSLRMEPLIDFGQKQYPTTIGRQPGSFLKQTLDFYTVIF